jgi:protein involved in temperature-dependent protein secretion
MLWRGAEITTHDHETLAVRFPVLYPGTSTDSEEAIRLGRAADWTESSAGIRRGKGVRSFAIGGDTWPIVKIETLSLTL